MKKYFLLIIIYLGIFPVMHNRKLILLHINHAHASSSFSDEDGDDGGDPSDPDDPDDPDDPNDPTPPDCSGGYTGDPVTQTSLDGNITTTTNCYEVYDGCGNDLGQSCDVPTQCGIESASIYLSASTGNLGDDVILNATVTTVGGATPLFEFQQSSDGGTSWDDVGNDPNVASFTYTIDESGQNKFRVIVSCSCSIAVTSSPAICTVTAPSCGVTGVTLSLSANSGNLRDNVVLTAAIQGKSGTPVLTYDFQILSNGSYVDAGTPTTGSTYTYTVDEISPQFQVVVTSVCPSGTTKVTSDPQTFTTPNSCTSGIASDALLCSLMTDPCDGLSAASSYLSQNYPSGTNMSSIPGTTPANITIQSLFTAFYSYFPLPGTITAITNQPSNVTVTSNGEWLINNTTANGLSTTSGSGSSAVSTLYISPSVLTNGYNPLGIIAELGHELIHAYLDQNNITGINQDYICYTYQAAVCAEEGDTDNQARYLNQANTEKLSDPNFNEAANDAVINNLPPLPTIPTCPN